MKWLVGTLMLAVVAIAVMVGIGLHIPSGPRRTFVQLKITRAPENFQAVHDLTEYHSCMARLISEAALKRHLLQSI